MNGSHQGETTSNHTWDGIQRLCGNVVRLAGRASLLLEDCRITGRFVRKLSGVLCSLQEENMAQPFADVDSCGMLSSTLHSVLDLVARCQLAGRVEAFLETAALRMEFKTFAADLRTGLERLEMDQLMVPNDVADDIHVLQRQLAQIEFTVAADREASALAVHHAVLLERTGLQHDKYIVSLLKDVLQQCNLGDATAPDLLFEARSLRRRAAEAHNLQDHVHELVLYKVAELLERDFIPTAPSPSPRLTHTLPLIPSTPYAETDENTPTNTSPHPQNTALIGPSICFPGLPPALPPSFSASLHSPLSQTNSHGNPHYSPVGMDRRASLVRRASFGVAPPPTSIPSVNVGGSTANKPSPGREHREPACNEVMLRSTSSHSLLSMATTRPASTADLSSMDNTPSTCSCVSAAEEIEVDPDDIRTVAQALNSDNSVTLELAASCLLHQGCDEIDWDALCGARMRLIRPLINILRYRHPLSLKVTVAALLRCLAKDKDNRKLISESGGLLLLLRLLRNPSDPAKQAAARAITNVAYGNTAVKGELIQAGILELLNEMMEGLHPTNQEAAALAVANLACSPDSAKALVSAGTLSVCVSVLKEGSIAGRQAAARALRNILHHHADAKAAAVEQGAVPLLLDLMVNSEGGARHSAIMALGCMAAKNDKIKDTVTFEGALQVLVAQLADADVAVREAAASTLATMCTSNTARQNIAAAGGVEALVALLRSPGAPSGAPAGPAGLPAGLPAGGASDVSEEQIKGLRTAAALAIRALVSCENHSIKQAVAAAGTVPLLTSLLGGSDGEIAQKAATGALWNLAYKNEENRNIIRDSGAIPHLVRLLKSYQPESMRRQAARAISNLSCNNPTNQLAIASAGAIPPLVHLLQSGSPCSVEAAARALSNLALQDNNQASIAAAGAVPALIQVVASGPDNCQEASLRAYGNVIVNNHHSAVMATSGRAIPLLKEILCREGKRVMQLEASRALGNLACLGASAQDDIVNSGVISSLVKMLDSGHDGTRESAACTLWDIAYDNDHARRAIVTANGVPYLVQALLFGGRGTKEAAASTLLELACVGCKTDEPRGVSISGNAGSLGDIPEMVMSPKRSMGRQMEVHVERGSEDGESVLLSSASTSEAAHSRVQSASSIYVQEHSWSAQGLQRQLTARSVRSAIIEAGGMPLFIQLACSSDKKLNAVGTRALEVMGFSADSQELQQSQFPQVSAYHQPQLLQPQLLSAHF